MALDAAMGSAEAGAAGRPCHAPHFVFLKRPPCVFLDPCSHGEWVWRTVWLQAAAPALAASPALPPLPPLPF